jgi:hypothetical protein
MPTVVRAFPLLAGQEHELRRFATELAEERRFDADRFYTRYGVAREAWMLQQTPAGPWVIVVSDVRADIQTVAQAYGAADEPFTRWLKERAKQLTGIDLDEAPLGPPTAFVFEWTPSDVRTASLVGEWAMPS